MNDAFGRPQTILVIGAGSDIAAATLERLRPTSQRIGLAGRNPKRFVAEFGQAVRGDCECQGFHFEALEASTHTGLIAEVTGWMGDIDLAIVAHGDLGEPFNLNIDPNEVARLCAVNHGGAASISHAIAQRLAVQGHGTLVALSSVAAVRPRAGNLPYASAKAGFDAFALGLDHLLADTGARVMVVRPGFVHTKMTNGLKEQPLATDAATVADAIVDGLAKRRPIVWVPAPLKASPLFRLLPTSLWRRLSDR